MLHPSGFGLTCTRTGEIFFKVPVFVCDKKDTFHFWTPSHTFSSLLLSEQWVLHSVIRLDKHVLRCCLSDIYKLQSCCSRQCLIIFWTKLITCRLHLHNFSMDFFQISHRTLRAAYFTKCHPAAVSWAGTSLNAEGRFCQEKLWKAQVPSAAGRPERLVYQSCPLPSRPRKWKKGLAGVLHKRTAVWHMADGSTNLWTENSQSQNSFITLPLEKGLRMFSCTLCAQIRRALGQKGFLGMRPFCWKMLWKMFRRCKHLQQPGNLFLRIFSKTKDRLKHLRFSLHIFLFSLPSDVAGVSCCLDVPPGGEEPGGDRWVSRSPFSLWRGVGSGSRPQQDRGTS